MRTKRMCGEDQNCGEGQCNMGWRLQGRDKILWKPPSQNESPAKRKRKRRRADSEVITTQKLEPGRLRILPDAAVVSRVFLSP